MDRQNFRAVVRDLASDGRAVVLHPSGYTVFVSGAWVGEEIDVEIVERKGKFGIGRLVDIIKPSQDRINPPCEFHGHTEINCGGCPWQFIRYEAQLTAKRRRVEKAMAAIGVKYGIKEIEASTAELAYRNRAQLKTDGAVIGLLANKSSSLVAVDDCLVLSEKNRQTLKDLNSLLPFDDWKPVRSQGVKRKSKQEQRQSWTTLDIDESIDAEQVSVNQRLPFKQANDAQNTFMQQWLSSKLSSLDKSYSVLELFSGEGNFTSVISETGFESILAADIAGDAIELLRRKELSKVTAVAVDLFDKKIFENLVTKNPCEILVLDPPRDGLKAKDGLFAKHAQLSDVFYIYCDLATLTRDLKDFIAQGFKVREIQPLDMFPQTPHIEMLVHLRKKQS